MVPSETPPLPAPPRRDASDASGLGVETAVAERGGRRSSASPAPGAPRRPSRFVLASLVAHAAVFVAFAAADSESRHAARPSAIHACFESQATLAPDFEVDLPPVELPERPAEECAEVEEPAMEEFLPPEAETEFADARSVLAVADRFARNQRLPGGRVRGGWGDGTGDAGGSGAPGASASAAPSPAPAAPPPPAAAPAPELSPARLIDGPPPCYPESSRASGVAGIVKLVAEVLEDGSVGDVEIVESSGSRSLDDAAVRAVRGWKFEPERIDGVPRRCRVRIPDIRFRLTR
jgi:protein TonB